MARNCKYIKKPSYVKQNIPINKTYDIFMLLNKCLVLAVTVKSSWESLREKYLREKRLLEAESASGSGSSSRTKFPYFQEMSFLAQHIRKRKTNNNFNDERNVSACFSDAKNRR